MSAKIKILFVEDDNDLREDFSYLLEEKGFVVTSVPSPVEAFTFLNTQKFDVILSDIIMPSMSGITFYKSLWEKFSDDLPLFYFLSANHSVSLKEIEHLPVPQIFRKPDDISILHSVIKENFAKHAQGNAQSSSTQPSASGSSK